MYYSNWSINAPPLYAVFVWILIMNIVKFDTDLFDYHKRVLMIFSSN